VPLTVMSELLAIPPADEKLILDWVDAFYHILEVSPMTPGQLVAADEASRSAAEYFGELVHERRRNPGADFVSGVLVANTDDPDPMTDEQIIANLFLLYFAGHDTQKLQFGNMLASLHRHPGSLPWLAEDTSRVPGAMPDLLRHDTVGQFMGRTVLEDVELGGKTIRAGQTVMLCMGAANRDPEMFTEPDRLRFDRPAVSESLRHISFGAGRHHCLGAQMAQANLPVMLRVLLERLPNLQVNLADAVRHPSIATRGYDVLPVTWRG
jgi:hypothetical protein